MRVGLLTEYPLSARAGWESSIRHIAEALQASGHEVTLLHEAPCASPTRQLFRRLSKRPARIPLTDAQLRRAAALADARSEQVDVILSVLGSRLLHAMRTEKPAVHVSDATWKRLEAEYPGQRERNNPSRLVEQPVMDRCFHHVYSSEWARSSAVHEYGVPQEKTSVLPLGANLIPDQEEALPGPPPPGARCELLFVARDWKRKNGDCALETLAALRMDGIDAHLSLIGAPPSPLPASLSDAVRPLGWLEVSRPRQAEACRAAYRASHFLLLPTLADCTPIVCAEASAFGVPCIASEVGGVPTMVRPGQNGALMPPGASGTDYATVIREIWRDRARYQQLRYDSQALFQSELNWAAWAQGIDPILRHADDDLCSRVA